MALNLKGVEYEYVEEDISNKSAMLLQYNPVYKKVPILLHDGKPIVESLMIVEYIDEIWETHPLLPKDPFERAKSRFWAKYVDDQCLGMIKQLLRSTQETKENDSKEARQILKTLESSLDPNKPFSGVKSLGFIDIAFAWLGIWAQVLEKLHNIKLLDEENTPLLNKHFRDILDVPVIKDCIPPLEQLFAHTKFLIERNVAAARS
uniref:glutathione transferase GST 23-like n=1 Tax=Erigeron canadensis TaxID=72917 RepID=UPI001CB97303|nr:glutathione transferase GST 23-like [Erigeron canadensis]